VLNKAKEPELREEAASELGDHNHLKAVKLLLHTAMQDQNLEVREEAASALEDIDLSESVDALITIARKSPDFSVKEEAVEALADKASARIAEELNRLASEETETVRLINVKHFFGPH
jgi:HEAT repeat protein